MPDGSQATTAETVLPVADGSLRVLDPTFVVVVAGAAGSGKTTLGTALAQRLRAVPLDLDSLTNPLLDVLGDVLPGNHWLAGPHAERIRAGRYAVLRSAARDAVAAGSSVVLVAPFTAELQGGREWEELCSAVAPHPVHVLHLDGPAEVLAARRSERGEARDGHRNDVPARRPRVPHTVVDVLLSPLQQQFRALQALGRLPGPDPAHPVFRRTFDAVLFDVDGTLVDSTAAVLRAWARLGEEFEFPGDAVQRNHGRPPEALLAEYLPADRWPLAIARVEEFETADVGGVTVLPGALDLLAALPAGRVALVTSATRAVVRARLAAAGVPAPAVVVSRDDVQRPKPDPEPFLRAAGLLGVDPRRCLVVEDAPAGVAAAVAAGCAVVAVGGTVEPAELVAADLVAQSLDQCAVEVTPEGLRLLPAGR